MTTTLNVSRDSREDLVLRWRRLKAVSAEQQRNVGSAGQHGFKKTKSDDQKEKA